MKSFIENFANQLEEASNIASQLSIQLPSKSFSNITILGLGGSAFGAELLKNYTEKSLDIPIAIVRDYSIPKYINENSLVIASSYSGNTEETLSALHDCIQAKAFIVCITSGGKLLETAQQNQYPYIQLPTGYPPRTAAGFSFISKVTILHKLHLIPDFQSDFQEAFNLIQSFSDFESVRHITQNFYQTIPVIYSSPSNESVSIRLRQQIQENSKQLCWHHVIPEMNHNELVGWELPFFALEKTHVLLIRSNHDHQRIQYRIDFVKQKLESKGVKVSEIYLKGNSKMAQLIYGLHFSDWVSYELALLNQVDPTPVTVIDELKNSLAAK